MLATALLVAATPACVSLCGVSHNAEVIWPNAECSMTGDVQRLNADGGLSPFGFKACIAEYHGTGISTYLNEVETDYTTVELALMPAAGTGRVEDQGSKWMTLIFAFEQTARPAPPAPAYRYPLGPWSPPNPAQPYARDPIDVKPLNVYGTSNSEAVGHARPVETNLEGELATDNFAFDIVAKDGQPDYGTLTIALDFSGVELPADSKGYRAKLSGQVVLEANKAESAVSPSGGGTDAGCTGACGTRFSCKAADTPTALGVCVDYLIMDAARAATLKGQCVSPAKVLGGNCASAGVTGPTSCLHKATNGDVTCTYSSFTKEKCIATEGIPGCGAP